MTVHFPSAYLYEPLQPFRNCNAAITRRRERDGRRLEFAKRSGARWAKVKCSKSFCFGKRFHQKSSLGPRRSRLCVAFLGPESAAIAAVVTLDEARAEISLRFQTAWRSHFNRIQLRSIPCSLIDNSRVKCSEHVIGIRLDLIKIFVLNSSLLPDQLAFFPASIAGHYCCAGILGSPSGSKASNQMNSDENLMQRFFTRASISFY